MSDSLPLFIKDMRKKFGLTQVDLAAKSDCVLYVNWSKVRKLCGWIKSIRYLLFSGIK